MSVYFGELKRLEISLYNMKKCFLKNMNLQNDENKNNKIYDKIFRNKYHKCLKIIDEDRFKRILENIWINEIFLRNSVENNKESDYENNKLIIGNNHFFFMDYVAFYYSIFNSVSLLIILFQQNCKRESHKNKIQNFNVRINDMKYLKKHLQKPFSIIINKNHCDLNNKKWKVDAKFQETLNKYIKSYTFYTKQRDLNGNPMLKECENTLRFSRSLVKAYLNENEKSYSFVNYLLSFRHFFHYNVSVVIDDSVYDFNRLIHNIREDCYFLLTSFNFIVEILFYNLTAFDFKEVYDNFSDRLTTKSCGLNTVLLKDIEKRIDLIFS